jgi:hypothetical protein
LGRARAVGRTEIHKDVLSEIGSRYGEKLAGYWFDSWYQSLAAYPDVPIEAIYRYCKVGNLGRLSPLLLVRDTRTSKLIIADGYHRLCAVYMFDEDAVIPCKIV